MLEDKIAITKNASAGHEISHSCEPEIACDNVSGHWWLRVGLRRTAPWMCWIRPVRSHAPHRV